MAHESLTAVADRIGDRYFSPHMTALSCDEVRRLIVVDLDPKLLAEPERLAALMVTLRDAARPYRVRFGFEPAAVMG